MVCCVFYSYVHVYRIVMFCKMRIINICCDNKPPDRNVRCERRYWQGHFPMEPPPDAAARSAPCLGCIMWALVCLQLLLILFLTQFSCGTGAVNEQLTKIMQLFCNSLKYFFQRVAKLHIFFPKIALFHISHVCKCCVCRRFLWP